MVQVEHKQYEYVWYACLVHAYYETHFVHTCNPYMLRKSCARYVLHFDCLVWIFMKKVTSYAGLCWVLVWCWPMLGSCLVLAYVGFLSGAGLCWVLVWFGFFQVQLCWESCILLRPMFFENRWNSQNRPFEMEKGINYTYY